MHTVSSPRHGIGGIYKAKVVKAVSSTVVRNMVLAYEILNHFFRVQQNFVCGTQTGNTADYSRPDELFSVMNNEICYTRPRIHF